MMTHEFDLMVYGHSLRVCYIQHQPIPHERPTIVFLHDSLGCITLWRDFPERLARVVGCNALVYDRQGYGESVPFTTKRGFDYLEQEAHVLSYVLRQCEISEAILFGHSDGGSIALVTAAEYPHMVRAVISEAAHVFVDHLTLQGVAAAKEQYRTTNLRQRVARYHGDKTDAVFHAWTDTWLADWYRNWSIEHYLSRIQCPLLAIQGEEDEFGTKDQIDRITRQAGGESVSYILPGIGHTPHKESPELIVEMTDDFLKPLLSANGH